MGQFIYTLGTVICYLVFVLIFNIHRVRKTQKIDFIGVHSENMFAMFFLLAQLNGKFVSSIQYSILVAICLVGTYVILVILEIMNREKS